MSTGFALVAEDAGARLGRMETAHGVAMLRPRGIVLDEMRIDAEVVQPSRLVELGEPATRVGQPAQRDGADAEIGLARHRAGSVPTTRRAGDAAGWSSSDARYSP